jgi:DNA-binding CsgD family transcriptional regulator
MGKSLEKTGSSRLGDMAAMVKVMQPLGSADGDPQRKRRLLADLCRLIGEHVNGTESPASLDETGLTPRMRQTLHSLLAGDSEKQVAAKLGVSQHTVHVYVKKLYRKFDVCSRGELLAKWVRKR